MNPILFHMILEGRLIGSGSRGCGKPEAGSYDTRVPISSHITGCLNLNRAGFAGGSNSCVGWSIMSKATNKFSPEVRKRAVRLVLDTEA